MPRTAPAPTSKQPGPGKGARGSLLVAVVAMSALWVVFVAGFHSQEMLVGGLSVAASLGFLAVMWRAQEDHVSFQLRDVVQAWRVPGQVVVDAFAILRVLWRDLFGGRRAMSFYEVHHFNASPPCPEMLGRELLAVAYLTASPNSIVLGVDGRKGMLMVHQLIATATPELARKLGIGDQL